MPIDKYPFSERYGWIQDKYGLTWQVVPSNLGEMMQKGSREKIAAVIQAFLQMKKFDVAALQMAYEGAMAT